MEFCEIIEAVSTVDGSTGCERHWTTGTGLTRPVDASNWARAKQPETHRGNSKSSEIGIQDGQLLSLFGLGLDIARENEPFGRTTARAERSAQVLRSSASRRANCPA
jgi:hypothetical protein